MVRYCSYLTGNLLFNILEDVLKSIRRLKPLLNRQSPPAWTNTFLTRAGGFHLCSSDFNRQVKRLKLNRQSPPAWTNTFLTRAGGFHLCSSDFNRQVKY